MTRQEKLIASLTDKYEEYLEQYPDKKDGIIHILASIALEKGEDADYYKKLWNTEFSRK